MDSMQALWLVVNPCMLTVLISTVQLEACLLALVNHRRLLGAEFSTSLARHCSEIHASVLSPGL